MTGAAGFFPRPGGVHNVAAGMSPPLIPTEEETDLGNTRFNQAFFVVKTIGQNVEIGAFDPEQAIHVRPDDYLAISFGVIGNPDLLVSVGELSVIEQDRLMGKAQFFTKRNDINIDRTSHIRANQGHVGHRGRRKNDE